ncbi:MAG: hypothetical protein RR576_03700 [Oscillospiraceae bacterium]
MKKDFEQLVKIIAQQAKRAAKIENQQDNIFLLSISYREEVQEMLEIELDGIYESLCTGLNMLGPEIPKEVAQFFSQQTLWGLQDIAKANKKTIMQQLKSDGCKFQKFFSAQKRIYDETLNFLQNVEKTKNSIQVTI